MGLRWVHVLEKKCNIFGGDKGTGDENRCEKKSGAPQFMNIHGNQHSERVEGDGEGGRAPDTGGRCFSWLP